MLSRTQGEEGRSPPACYGAWRPPSKKAAGVYAVKKSRHLAAMLRIRASELRCGEWQTLRSIGACSWERYASSVSIVFVNPAWRDLMSLGRLGVLPGVHSRTRNPCGLRGRGDTRRCPRQRGDRHRFEIDVHPESAGGTVKAVLLEWELPAIDLWAVYPADGNRESMHFTSLVQEVTYRPAGAGKFGSSAQPIRWRSVWF